MFTKENIKKIKRTAKAPSNGQQEIFMLVFIWMMKDMAMVKCSGQMALFMLDNGKEEFSMVMGKLLFLMAQVKKATSRITSM